MILPRPIDDTTSSRHLMIHQLPRELLELIKDFLDISSRFALIRVAKFYANQDIMIDSNHALHDAISNFHTDLFKWLLHQRFDDNSVPISYFNHFCEDAAEKGSLDILKYLHNNINNTWTRSFQRLFVGITTIAENHMVRSFEAAIKGGHLEIVQWLYDETRYYSGQELCCQLAAINGHLDIMKWLFEHGFRWDADAFKFAADYGHLDILKYLNGRSEVTWDKPTFDHAVANDNLEIVEYLYENECPWDTYTFGTAAFHGHLEIIKYLYEHNCPWNEETCSNAAKNNQLEVLKYLHDNGCHWNDRSYYSAIQYGHLEIVKYLHENECPWSMYVFERAAIYCRLEILQYLHDNECPWNVEERMYITTIDTFLSRIQSEHYPELKYKRCYSIYVTNKNILDWLGENGYVHRSDRTRMYDTDTDSDSI